jgi:hypothetical protein
LAIIRQRDKNPIVAFLAFRQVHLHSSFQRTAPNNTQPIPNKAKFYSIEQVEIKLAVLARVKLNERLEKVYMPKNKEG